MWSTNFITLAVLFIAIVDPSIAQSGGAGAATIPPSTVSAAEAAGAGAGKDARGLDDDELRTLVTFKLFEPLSFNCTNQANTDAATRYVWFRNDTLFEAGGPKGHPTLDPSGAVLTIRRAHEEDWGNYTCRVGNAVAGAWQAEALNLPRVPPNTNVVEGQKFTITCKIIGKPHQPVTWWYRPSTDANLTQLVASEEGGRVVTRDSPAGVPGGVLEMSDAARADAGEYLCRAGGPPEAEVREDISTVRVKDVYAALWPFLGICLEVFVLCAIILVYEKRRTKPELDDSDADTHDQ